MEIGGSLAVYLKDKLSSPVALETTRHVWRGEAQGHVQGAWWQPPRRAPALRRGPAHTQGPHGLLPGLPLCPAARMYLATYWFEAGCVRFAIAIKSTSRRLFPLWVLHGVLLIELNFGSNVGASAIAATLGPSGDGGQHCVDYL